MSYLSCVKVWLIGHHFGIDAMKDIAATKAASVSAELTKNFVQLSESQERECERAHLASLTRAVSTPFDILPFTNPPPLAGFCTQSKSNLVTLCAQVKLANRHEWHAALWKMLYDAGEAVAPKLLCHPSFQSYIKTDEGQDYARAIRASERAKPQVETGRGRGNGGVTKRPARGGRRGRKVFGRGQRLS